MRRCRSLLGTFAEIECDCADAIDAGFAAIARIHALMSAHEPESELSQINRFAHLRPIEVSDDTATVLSRALFWSAASDGAFDVVRAGYGALAHGRLPIHPDQPQPTGGIDWRSLQVNGTSVALTAPACLDLGGIAKGYAVDAAVLAMQCAGASSGLVNAGGDIRGFGATPWPIAIVAPATRTPLFAVNLVEEAVATSAGLPGNGGLVFDHLGGRTNSWLSVTVAAPTACDADALTKIVWSLGQRASALLSAADADAVAIRSDGTAQQIGQQALAA